MDYRPWLTVRTKGLNSNTWRPHGKNGRTYHLLSNTEMAIFMLLDHSERTVDIREQFPLFPLEKTCEIAHELGYRHPMANPFKDKMEGKVNIVMTTDFVVDLRDGDGLPASVAISVKPADLLDDNSPIKLKNLLMKAEIERRYWGSLKVPFLLITEADTPPAVRQNVDLLHRFNELKGVALPAPIDEIAAHMLDLIVAAPSLAIKEHGQAFDKRMGLKRGTGLVLVWHCIASGRWRVDLTVPLDPGRALPKIVKAGGEASTGP